MTYVSGRCQGSSYRFMILRRCCNTDNAKKRNWLDRRIIKVFSALLCVDRESTLLMVCMIARNKKKTKYKTKQTLRNDK